MSEGRYYVVAIATYGSFSARLPNVQDQPAAIRQ